MNTLTVEQVEQEYHALVAGKEYAAALNLATQYFDLFPQHAQQVVYYWRMDMATRCGNTALALQLLQEALDRGHWYAKLDENPHFQALHDLPAFQRLTALSAQRREQAIADAKPFMKVLLPEAQPGPYPIIFGLHGNSSSAGIFGLHWSAAVKQGWLVGLPQAPQAYGPDRYSWNDWDWCIPALQAQFRSLCDQYPVDPERAVLAGFSMGAGLALWLALEETIPVRGVIAVAPFLSNPEALNELLAQAASKDLRFYLVASQKDEYCYQVAGKLADMFSQYGIVHKIDIYEDVEHAFPPSFEDRLPQALEFILKP